MGEPGTTFLVGHRSWRKGEPAIFDNLSNVKLGDVIIVHNGSATKVTYIVTGMKVYDRSDPSTEALVSSAPDSTLRLITCIGAWDYEAHTASQRLVVFAEKFPR